MSDEGKFPDKDGGQTIDGSTLPEMDIQEHDGDPVREAINRMEYFDHVAVGEVDGHDVEVKASVIEHNLTKRTSVKLIVKAGGDWDPEAEHYLGGIAYNVGFDTVWELDEVFGELCREHGLLILPPKEVRDDV